MHDGQGRDQEGKSREMNDERKEFKRNAESI